MLRLLLACTILSAASHAASAQESAAREGPPSQCLAVAQNLDGAPGLPPIRFASLATPAQATTTSDYTVTISYQGHSTYLIESPGGATIATDYAGWMTDPVIPLAVTMNQAHSSHYTDNIKPGTEHVFRGWGEGGKPAAHNEQVGDVVIRNVTTDIMRFGTIPDGNSIFIFETAGLCIGHLGHLHHELTDDHYAQIGRLDIVMVAIDGGLTMTHLDAKEILERLRSSIVLPMHVRAYGAMQRFLGYMGNSFAVERMRENRLRVSLRTLPDRPTITILPGVDTYAGFE